MTTDTLAINMPVEVRATGNRCIGGYAAVFNSDSQDLGGFTERVAPSMFLESRNAGWPNVICRYNHDDEYLLGSTRHRTLRLWLDDTGLNYEVNVPVSRDDVLDRVRRGEIRYSSFSFADYADDWRLSDQGFRPLRTLLTGRLVDVAPVYPTPAYRATSVEMRSLTVNITEDRGISQTCLGGCLSLAAHTGLGLLLLTQLAEQGRLPELFDIATRKLAYASGRRISMAEQRSLARERGVERMPGRLAYQIAMMQQMRWATR